MRVVLAVVLPVVVAVGLGVPLTGCPRTAPPPVKRLVLGTTVEPDSLSPLLGSNAAAREAMALVARDLVVTDPSWQNIPDLAASIPTQQNGGARLEGSQLVVTWQLRDDARWSDGSPVTAADFIRGWQMQTDPAQPIVSGRDDGLRIASMVASPDGRSFVVTWKEPNPFFAEPRVHRPVPASPGLANGPFRLVEQVPGQFLRFARNPHFRPAPRLDEVIIKIAPSTTSLLTMLQSGDIDAALPAAGPSPSEARAFAAAHPDFVVDTAPGQVWTHLDMNLDDPWLQDVRLRRAIAAAIPRRQIFDALGAGLYELAETYLPPRHWGHAKLPPLAFDPDAAKALLDEAGWSALGDDGVRTNARGERLSLELAAASGQPETEQLLTLVKQALLDVGIEVRLDLRPFKVFFGEGVRKRKLPHLAFFAWTLDGSSMGGGLWRSDKIPSEDNGFQGQNFPGWNNHEATALLQRADATLDLAERQRQLARVQQLVRDEMPTVPMSFRPVVVVHHRRVRGLVPTGTQTPLPWNAWVWDVDAP